MNEEITELAAEVAELTEENRRLKALLRDTEFLYRACYVLAREAGAMPSSQDLLAAAQRFDDTINRGEA